MRQKLRDRVNAGLVQLNLVSEETIESIERAKASVNRNKYNTDTIALQRVVVAFVATELGDKIYDILDGKRVGLEGVLEEAQLLIAPLVHITTLRRWVRHYCCFGETKKETDDTKSSDDRKYRSRKWTADETGILRELVEEMPWMYLDKMQDELYKRSGKHFSITLIWFKLKKDLRFSLKVAFERASQWDEEERRDYVFWRDWHLEDNPEMALFLDETHKDRKAARRRRIWSLRNRTAYYDSNFFGGILDKLYTMLAACDVNGFIFSTIELVEKDGNTLNKETGTIDTERFEMWVEQRLCPVLGNYIAREPRSLVILDNASIHHSDKVVDLIESKGAKVIYTAPFAADLNPIENMFGEYKKGLKRFTPYMPWYEAYFKSLTLVTPKMAKGFFRGCGIQGCESSNDDLDKCDSSELESSMFRSAVVMAIMTFRFSFIDKLMNEN